ncbi:hypothetical protein GW17_00021570 [Ensete ventricosum]|nr:hypothetical protein GW17_00021570 [Ensete ventricosum]
MSNFASELAPESGRLRELPRLGAMVVSFQAGPPGSGLLATLFAGVPSGEPVGELMHELGRYGTMVCTIPASAWTWLVRPRKASAVTTNGAGLDAGEENPGGPYSDSNGVSVPESFIFFIAYRAAVPHHAVRSPYGEARACR